MIEIGINILNLPNEASMVNVLALPAVGHVIEIPEGPLRVTAVVWRLYRRSPVSGEVTYFPEVQGIVPVRSDNFDLLAALQKSLSKDPTDG